MSARPVRPTEARYARPPVQQQRDSVAEAETAKTTQIRRPVQDRAPATVAGNVGGGFEPGGVDGQQASVDEHPRQSRVQRCSRQPRPQQEQRSDQEPNHGSLGDMHCRPNGFISDESCQQHCEDEKHARSEAAQQDG